MFHGHNLKIDPGRMVQKKLDLRRYYLDGAKFFTH